MTLRAQELEPRAYSNSPTGLNFAIVGYGNAKGSVLTDPSLPLDNVSNESHVALFAYATTLNVLGKSAKVDVIVPYLWLTANGVAFGVPRQRYVTAKIDFSGNVLLGDLHSKTALRLAGTRMDRSPRFRTEARLGIGSPWQAS